VARAAPVFLKALCTSNPPRLAVAALAGLVPSKAWRPTQQPALGGARARRKLPEPANLIACLGPYIGSAPPAAQQRCGARVA
jgi:hypothetical protein